MPTTAMIGIPTYIIPFRMIKEIPYPNTSISEFISTKFKIDNDESKGVITILTSL